VEREILKNISTSKSLRFLPTVEMTTWISELLRCHQQSNSKTVIGSPGLRSGERHIEL